MLSTRLYMAIALLSQIATYALQNLKPKPYLVQMQMCDKILYLYS